VNLRSLGTTGNMATVQKSMNSLDISAFDTDGSTDWSVLRLRLDGSVENTVQIDLGVANVVDGLFPSSIHVDFLHEEKKLLAPDEQEDGGFGWRCSMSNSRFVIGAPFMGDSKEGAAYLYDLGGNLIKKLTSGSDAQFGYWFGFSVCIDEKIVVGQIPNTNADGHVRVFSQEGIYERTIECIGCDYFGQNLDTFGDKIGIAGSQNNSWKLFIYSTTTGELLKVLETNGYTDDVSMSEQVIVSYDVYKTFVFSNTAPNYPQIAEIPQGGYSVATFGDRIVIGYPSGSPSGSAYLYKTDGTFIKDLRTLVPGIQPTIGSYYGSSVDITADRVFVSAFGKNGGGPVVLIFSASTGEFIEKIVAPDGDDDDYFGMSVCASSSHYVVGASGVDSAGGIVNSGEAYLFV